MISSNSARKAMNTNTASNRDELKACLLNPSIGNIDATKVHRSFIKNVKTTVANGVKTKPCTKPLLLLSVEWFADQPLGFRSVWACRRGSAAHWLPVITFDLNHRDASVFLVLNHCYKLHAVCAEVAHIENA